MLHLVFKIFLFTVLMLGSPVHVYAQDIDFMKSTADSEQNDSSIGTSRSEQFFNECKAAPIMSVNKETDEAFCSCAAANMQQWYDKKSKDEENSLVLQDLGDKDLNKNTLMADIYGPCIYLPIFDMTYDECYYNKQNEYFMDEPRRRQGYCACIARGESSYFQSFMQPFLQYEMAQGKDIIDPVGDIRKDTNYYDANYATHHDCVVEWTHKK